MDFVNQFTKEVNQAHPRPECLALAIAGLAYPDLQLATHLSQLDEMAEQVRRALWPSREGKPRAELFLQIINQELGFNGNRENYYDPDNSFLNRVIERRSGLPIMLSLICMAIGERLQMDITGIGFPGHFMARYQDGAGAWLLDPFNATVLDEQEASAYLSGIFAQPITLSPSAYEAVGPLALAQRILNNLRGIYLNRRDFGLAACVVNYLLVLAPTDAYLWRERGLLHHYDNNWAVATRDLRRYLFLTGQLLRTFETAKAAQPPVAALDVQNQQVWRVFQQAEETQRRVN